MAKTAPVLDFTNVKDGGGAFNKRHQPAGDYKAKVTKVDWVNKKDDKSTKMWLFTITVGGGTYAYYCTYAGNNVENQLWKIRNLFTAAGINVPKKRVAVDPSKVVGKTIAVTLEDEEYNGKMQSTVNATFPVSELDGDTDSDDDEGVDDDDEEVVDAGDEDDDEEEAPAPKAKKKKKAKKVKDEDLEALDIEEI